MEDHERMMRVDKEFKDAIRKASINRLKNDIDSVKRSEREMSKMMMNCPSFPNILNELSTIPKKEDLARLRKL